MNKGNLKHCLNYTKLLIDFMHPLIQDIQELDPSFACFAIEAQELMRKTEVLLKNPPHSEWGGTLRCVTSHGRNVNIADELNKIDEDKILRDLIENTPSYLDLDDPEIIAFDKYGKGMTAKDLKDLEENGKK